MSKLEFHFEVDNRLIEFVDLRVKKRPMSNCTVERVRNSYAELLDLYYSLPTETLVKARIRNRTIKERLAELAGWTWRCAAIIKAAQRTNAPLLANPDVGGLRQEYYQDSYKQSWSEVEDDYRHAQQALLKVIHNLPVERRQAALIQQTISAEILERRAHFWAELKQIEQVYASHAWSIESKLPQFPPNVIP